MTPTLQSQFEDSKTRLVNELTRIIQKAAKEAVESALSSVSAPKKSLSVLRIGFKEGKFEALVNGRLVRRSRRRDLVRYAKDKGYVTPQEACTFI